MAHRVGVCSSCGARFQIPATFAPDRARCRTCGGVVEIGPAVGVEAPPPRAPVAAPIVAPSPEPAPEPVLASPAPTPIVVTKRGPSVLAVLVGALVLAALAFGAWRLFA
jgi:hypothetical protein